MIYGTIRHHSIKTESVCAPSGPHSHIGYSKRDRTSGEVFKALFERKVGNEDNFDHAVRARSTLLLCIFIGIGATVLR